MKLYIWTIYNTANFVLANNVGPMIFCLCKSGLYSTTSICAEKIWFNLSVNDVSFFLSIHFPLNKIDPSSLLRPLEPRIRTPGLPYRNPTDYGFIYAATFSAIKAHNAYLRRTLLRYAPYLVIRNTGFCNDVKQSYTHFTYACLYIQCSLALFKTYLSYFQRKLRLLYFPENSAPRS